MCSKKQFDLKGAKSALKFNSTKSRQYRKETRYYECPICIGWWHLTSDEEYAESITIPLEELVYKDEWKSLMI